MLKTIKKRKAHFKSEEFVNNILDRVINYFQVPQENIICIMIGGSSLYLPNFHDLDVIIIVKELVANMHHRSIQVVENRPSDFIFYTKEEFLYNAYSPRMSYVWTALIHDYLPIYGDKKAISLNLLKCPYLWKAINDEFYYNFIRPTEILNNTGHKRYWNYLIFYYKIRHHTNKIPKYYYNVLQNAHDCKITKQECLKKYRELDQYINKYLFKHKEE